MSDQLIISLERQSLKPFTSKFIQIVVADDNADFCRTVAAMLESVEDIRIVGEAGNGKEAVELAADLQPEIVIMDIGMPVLNGLRASRQITGSPTKTKIIILSVHSDPEYIQEAIRSGASGYLFKQFTNEVLHKAIREVMNGETYFASPVSPHLRMRCRDLFIKDPSLAQEL